MDNNEIHINNILNDMKNDDIDAYLLTGVTNIEYISDCYDKLVDSSKSFGESADKILPFNKLKVWNEYQEGETSLQKKYPTFNKKFRIWRVDVPRDKHSLRDRIRNPWMMLELSNNKEHNNRMVFHNLLVKYYK